jgi:hydrogenase maturation protease
MIVSEPVGVVVFACGEPLRGDDGLGHVAVAGLAKSVTRMAAIRSIRCLGPEDLAELRPGTFVVIVDAVAGIEPGRLCRIDLERLGSECAQLRPTSSHQMPLADVLGLAELLGWEPRGVFLGVGAARVGIGDRMSPEVVRAIPELRTAVLDAIVTAPVGVAAGV